MRIARLLAPLVLVFALLVPAGVAGAKPAHTKQDATVTNPDDGTTIALTLFKPGTASPSRKVPMILHSHGWGGSRTTDIAAFQEWLDAGFGVLSFDQRGHGESSGEANVQDPTKETEDVQAVIDYVAKLPWVRHDVRGGKVVANDPVLGAIGGSYGGGYQTMTALDEIDENHGHTRFNALAPEITWFDLPNSLAPNKVPRSAWNTLLYAAGAAMLPTYVHEAQVWGAATGQWPDGTVLGTPVAGVPDIDTEFHKHSPVAFVDRGIKLNVPTLFRQGISDNLFNLNEGIANYEITLSPAARAQSYLVGYNGGHVLPNVLPMASATAGDACSPGGFTKLSIAFFKRVFAGKSTKGLLPAPINLTTEDGSRCVSGPAFNYSKKVAVEGPAAGDVVAISGPGAPLHLAVAQGPITVAGIPHLSGTVTTAGIDGRAFIGLAVGTSPATATVVQNNLMPMREALPVSGETFEFDLTGIAVDVPKGQTLYLTIAPFSDLFFGHGNKAPVVWDFSGLQLTLPGLGR